MLKVIDAVEIAPGLVDVKTEIKQVCANCGYDLVEAEIAADTCSDCGKPLNLKTSVTLHATSIPMWGATV